MTETDKCFRISVKCNVFPGEHALSDRRPVLPWAGGVWQYNIFSSQGLSERQSLIFSSIFKYMAGVQIVTTVVGPYQLVRDKNLLVP